MSVSELKVYITQNGHSHVKCIEKSELVSLAMEILRENLKLEMLKNMHTVQESTPESTPKSQDVLFKPTLVYSDKVYVVLVAESGGSAMSNCFIGKAQQARKFIINAYQGDMGDHMGGMFFHSVKKNQTPEEFKRRVVIIEYRENMTFSTDVYMCDGIAFSDLV